MNTLKLFKNLFVISSILFFSCCSDLTFEQKVESHTKYINKSQMPLEQEVYMESLSYSDAAVGISAIGPVAIHLKDLAFMKNISNRNIFIAILFFIYMIYVVLSFFVFKPLVNKKAITQIGGKYEISKDPLIWILPILLSLVFLIFYSDLIPKL